MYQDIYKQKAEELNDAYKKDPTIMDIAEYNSLMYLYISQYYKNKNKSNKKGRCVSVIK